MALSYYRKARTSLYASRADQRFSYCCYIPKDYDEAADKRYPLTVAVHGSRRNAETLRDCFIDFAERHQTIVLAPLFPCAIGEAEELHNYKRILHRGIRFDQLLLSMIDEIAEIYRLDTSRFLLHGFSGGGQFAHRFFFLYPERLLGVSIAAPGSVTLLDESRPWWIGVRDMEAVLGRAVNHAAMREVAVQMVIGMDDTETWEVTVPKTAPHYMEGANDAGVTRVDRIRSLKASFETAGIEVRLDMMPGVTHEGGKILPPVFDFFGEVLARREQGEGR